MSDAFLESLWKRRSDLQKELSELERFISFYESKINSNKVGLSKLVDIQNDTRPSKAIFSKAKNRSLPTRVAAASHDILIANGSPMTRGQIAQELMNRGMHLPSSDPAKYVGTFLWRHNHMFQNLEKEGYWIRGVPRK